MPNTLKTKGLLPGDYALVASNMGGLTISEDVPPGSYEFDLMPCRSDIRASVSTPAALQAETISDIDMALGRFFVQGETRRVLTAQRAFWANADATTLQTLFNAYLKS